MLTLEISAKGQDLSLAVAERLRNPEILQAAIREGVKQTSRPELFQWHPTSVGQGSAGLAVLFGHLDGCFPDSGWDVAGKWHLERVAEVLSEQGGASHYGLFSGMSGCAFAVWMLSRCVTRYRGMLGTIEDLLCPLLEQQAEGIIERGVGGLAPNDFDVISGLSGAAAYCLCRVDQERVRCALESILRCLVWMSQEQDGVPRWHTPAHLLLGGEMPELYPIGNLNCGLAHGIPGPLAAMSLARIEGVTVDGLEEAIDRLTTWLLDHRADDRWGINWPSAVALEEYQGRAPHPATRQPSRSAWCYGSPGISRALYLAGQALGRREYCDAAIDAIRAVLARPVGARMTDSPTFCHGIAGLLAITNRFALETRLPDLATGTLALTEQLLQAYEVDSILGFRGMDPDARRIDNAGLLDGAAGVALVLATVSESSPAAWERLFLIA
jgi:class I lanthipeptide synthase